MKTPAILHSTPFRQPEGPTSTFHNSLPLPPFGIAGTVSLVPRALSDLLTSPWQSRSPTTAFSLYAAHVSSHCGQTISATSNISCLPSYKRHSYLKFSMPSATVLGRQTATPRRLKAQAQQPEVKRDNPFATLLPPVRCSTQRLQQLLWLRRCQMRPLRQQTHQALSHQRVWLHSRMQSQR